MGDRHAALLCRKSGFPADGRVRILKDKFTCPLCTCITNSAEEFHDLYPCGSIRVPECFDERSGCCRPHTGGFCPVFECNSIVRTFRIITGYPGQHPERLSCTVPHVPV